MPQALSLRMYRRKYFSRCMIMFAHKNLLLLAVALTTGMMACLKPPDYPIEPVLTFVGLSQNSMVQGATVEDSIRVFLSFTDGDGDISPNPDGGSPNVYIINRKTQEVVTDFTTDPIPEEGAENGISGEISLRVFTTCCDYPDFVNAFPCEPTAEYPVDTLLLEAYMQDRAGNESNRVEIAPIYLLCDRF